MTAELGQQLEHRIQASRLYRWIYTRSEEALNRALSRFDIAGDEVCPVHEILLYREQKPWYSTPGDQTDQAVTQFVTRVFDSYGMSSEQAGRIVGACDMVIGEYLVYLSSRN